MAQAWLAGFEDRFVRGTYSRAPEDVVLRRGVEAGPPQRYLRAPSRAQLIKGQISASESRINDFEVWRKSILDYGANPFSFLLRDRPAPEAVVVRLASPPVITVSRGRSRRLALELRVDPPEPSLAAVQALAQLHQADPADWPAGIPGCPSSASFEYSPAEAILRSPVEAPASSVVITRLEGAIEKVVLYLSTAQLKTFEDWFETEAAFGVRDIRFPVSGGVHTGCFASGYTVTAPPERAGWAVRFDRYLEAQP